MSLYLLSAAFNVTLVTALFDLGRSRWPHFRRPFYIYLTYAVHLLSLHVPLVVYADPSLEPFLRYFRNSKPHFTTFVLTDLTQLSFAKAYGRRIADAMRSEKFHGHNYILDHPEVSALNIMCLWMPNSVCWRMLRNEMILMQIIITG